MNYAGFLHTYSTAQYQDAFGRKVTGMDELCELVPEFVTHPTYSWHDPDARKLKEFLGLGAHIWSVDRWDALVASGVPEAMYLPTVFSLDGLLYAVQADMEVEYDGQVLMTVSPVATKVGKLVLTNHDESGLDPRRGSRYAYLTKLRSKALRSNPGLSFRLAAQYGINLQKVRVLDRYGPSLYRSTTLFDQGDDTQQYLAFMLHGEPLLGAVDEGTSAKVALHRTLKTHPRVV